MARSISDIAQRARDKKLLPDDVQGGTFTITNPGGYGTFHGTPVISQPQAAILGTYAVVKRPWVIQDDRGEDVIAIRPIMNLTLTYDHRLVDGALAGRFLRDLREKLESLGRRRLLASLVEVDAALEVVLGIVLLLCAATGALDGSDFPWPVGTVLLVDRGSGAPRARWPDLAGRIGCGAAFGNAVTAVAGFLWLLLAEGWSTAGAVLVAITVAVLAGLAAAQAATLRA